MQLIEVQKKMTDAISVNTLGTDNDPKNTFWGKGIRDKYIIHYVLEGYGYFNGAKVSKGEGFFIKPLTLVEYHSSKRAPWRYFWISFTASEENVKKIFSDTGLLTENHIFSFEFTSDINELIERVMPSSSSVISNTLALSYFYSILAMHEQDAKRQIKYGAGEKHVNDAVTFMENNYHRLLKIEEVAKHVCLDNQYLYNLFEKHLGKSPKEYLNKIRIDRAKKLLKETSLSISYIGDSVGYDDSLAFSSFFKRHTGVSPREYRAIKREI